MILTLRTDRPQAEVGLYAPDGTQISYHKWQADRQLAKTLLSTVKDKLSAQNAKLTDLTGVVVFQGPGSFTGLRIGITVANAMAYGLSIPITAGQGAEWISDAIRRQTNNENDQLVLPLYGAEAHITTPRK